MPVNVLAREDMSKRHDIGGLSIEPVFAEFVETELLPAIGFDSATFWNGVESIINDLTPVNRNLLNIRDEFQQKIDEWHQARHGQPWKHTEYVNFLLEIGYLKSGKLFPSIETSFVDPEISELAAPQLVVPVNNARFAINAANARWGSLYDALYGTDVISEENGQVKSDEYNPVRGAAVIRYATDFIDRTLPLDQISHSDVNAYGIDHTEEGARFVASCADGQTVGLKDPTLFIGFSEAGQRRSFLFRHHELDIELQIDPTDPVGKDATANLADIILEAALTTIQDCEDSVAAVDAQDKVVVYRNWLGLMRGTLEATLIKNGKEIRRTLAKDRVYTSTAGEELVLSGRSVLLVRNVGHLMTNDAIIDADGNEVFEGILDAIITTACALTDRIRNRLRPNSRTGSIYIVKPKMHGPDEVAFTDTLFGRVEALFELEANTIKVGIMDNKNRRNLDQIYCNG